MDSVVSPAFRLAASPDVVGAEVLDLVDEPVILVANHSSHLDTPLLLSVLPRAMRDRTCVAAAADYFFDRTWKAHLFAFSLGAIPLERRKANRSSAELAVRLVREGWNLLVFPEGGRTPDGWMQEMRGGAAYVAEHTGRPVVPAYLSGTYAMLPKGGQGLRRGSVRVLFGRPLEHRQGEDARRLADRIFAEVAKLADESQSDWWAAARRAGSDTTPTPLGPDASEWRRAWSLPAASRPPATRVCRSREGEGVERRSAGRSPWKD